MSEIRAVVFDIDGTLLPDISWTRMTLGLGVSVPDHLRIYEDFKKGRMEYAESKKALLALWRGRGELRRERLKAMFDDWELKKDAKPLMDYLSAKGYLLCLITGSMDLFAETVAEKLGIGSWYANGLLHWDEEGFLRDFDWEPRAAEKKTEQFREFCAKHSLEPSQCAAVGDDSNDLELFRVSGRGILVESPTSQVLQASAWKKVRNLEEIMKIL